LDSELPLESLSVESMHNGHKSLNLTEQVSWAGFPTYASELGRVLENCRAPRVVADSVEMRIWELSISNVTVSLVWNDFPNMVSLESRDDLGDAVIAKAFLVLRDHLVRKHRHERP